ncbi:MAG: hypothetical protein KJ058_04005 [Thermoanaerobaculia bacterium]|nr:hypothetical protein [Thermoanaerobaculia bacterium]
MSVSRRLTPAALAVALLAALAGPAAAEEAPLPTGVYRGTLPVVKFDVSPPLREIAPLPIPDGSLLGALMVDPPSHLAGELGPQDLDPLVQSWTEAPLIPAPSVSFNGQPNISNVSPPDPVGDVGPNHYVSMSNLHFQIFDKAGNSLFGPAANNTLWAGFGGPCQTENAGDPIVLHDQLADRWILTQFTANGPTYFNCLAVSTTADPTGTWYRYAISTGSNFPDYPKWGVWPDAYYVSTREFAGASFAGVGAYAVNRAQVVAGNPAPTIISFLVTPAAAGGAFNIGDGLLPSDLDGPTQPPPGSPNYFVGSMDNGGPYGAPQDALTLWKFTANFTTPASSTFVLANTIPVAAFDSVPAFCSGRSCVPQPGTSNKVDHLGYRQRPLHRLAYRNFGTHESLVTNQSVEASATMSGIRWWEIRSPNSSPVIQQEGTYAPGVTDGIHRWMGSIAMDGAGNMALGYSASDGTSTFPSSWYTGRLAASPAGVMDQGEASIVTGTGSQTGSQRWGDYTSMNVDPLDDCTFWYVNQWVPTTSSVGWQLRIGAFKFDECGTPDFYLGVSPASASACLGGTANYTVNVGSISGFTDPVTLGLTGQPPGAPVGFAPNPVTPAGASALAVGPIAAGAAGSYPLTISGNSTTGLKTIPANLDLFTAVPGVAGLVAPANGATTQPLQPTFQWNAAAQTETYRIQIATDAGFAAIVLDDQFGSATTYTPGINLASNTTHYWRVIAYNPCGVGAASAVYSFTTLPLPGDCPVGSTAQAVYTYGFEAGAAGWTSNAAVGTNTWTISTAAPYAGSSHYRGTGTAALSDQRLVSPVIALPLGQDPVVLRFWHRPNLEANGATACYDGGVLEVSFDDGATWDPVAPSRMLVGPYRTGTISSSFSNPLAGRNAWCGATEYFETIVSLDLWEGVPVRFRWRIGTDTSVGTTGWDVDAVTVQSCLSGAIFSNGFEGGSTAAWSATQQ